MTQVSSQPMIRFPMRRLVCVEALAWLISGAVAIGVVGSMGAAQGAWMGAAACLGGLVAGLLVVAMSPEREAFNWAVIQIGASTVRMIVTLALGFGLYKSLGPDKVGFWSVLLLSSVAVLAAEVMVFLPVLRSANAGQTGAAVTEASA